MRKEKLSEEVLIEEINLGKAEVPYKGKFVVKGEGLLKLVSNCSCLSVPTAVLVDNKNGEKEVEFTLKSKSSLLEYQEKKVYIYGESLNEGLIHLGTKIIKFS